MCYANGMEPLAAQVRSARRRVKMSQDKLAALTTMTKGTIQNLEMGRTENPSIGALMKIIWTLKVPLEFEYGGKRFVLKLDGVAK